MTDEERRRIMSDSNERVYECRRKRKTAIVSTKVLSQGSLLHDEDSIKDKDDVRLKNYDEATGDDKFNESVAQDLTETKLWKEESNEIHTPRIKHDEQGRFMVPAASRHSETFETEVAGVHGHLDNAGRKRKRR